MYVEDVEEYLRQWVSIEHETGVVSYGQPLYAEINEKDRLVLVIFKDNPDFVTYQFGAKVDLMF